MTVTDWYRAVCPECDPEDGGDGDWQSARWPWESKAENSKQRHDRHVHGGDDTAEVVEVDD